MTESGEKQRVALGSILASALLAGSKLGVGLLTGSIGILSEAAHSFLDLGATLLTYGAVRVGDKPADAEHTYGHGKIESVAALAETGLLLLTSIWIVHEAVGRLLAPVAEVEATWYAIAVILLSIAVDAFRARALHRVARATRSQALEADALHFSTDILSSGVVLVGLALVWAGFPRGDALAAIGVAGFVCVAGWRLGRRTVDILIDTAPEGLAEDLTARLRAVPGVVDVARLRLRPAGKTVFVEAQVTIPRTLSVERAHAVAEAAAARIRDDLPDADVVVRPEPVPLDTESVADRVRVIARRHGLPVHHLTVQRLGPRTSIALDLEVDGRQALERAHATASSLEALIRDELGPEIEVETHIEPLQTATLAGSDLPEAERRAVAATVAAAAREVPALIDTHAVRARRTAEGLHLALHCAADGRATVEAVHEAVSQLEALLRQRLPGLRRVVTHAEPAKDPAGDGSASP
jgi:cation diffusion facilitator family transporter